MLRIDQDRVNQLADMLAQTAALNRNADHKTLTRLMHMQVAVHGDASKNDEQYATAYTSSKTGGTPEHITIDICIPKDPAALEDVEHLFECVRRKLKRDIANGAIANAIERVEETAGLAP